MDSTKTTADPRVGRRVVSQAIVIAVGVAADGRRQVLGFQVGDTESEPFWTEFFRDLKARGLSGVRLVISDAHAGLVRAIEVAFQGSAWQRCRVHFMRNVLARVPKVASQMVAAIIRTIFVPRGKRELVHAQFGEVVTMLARSHPAAAELLEAAKDDLLAFTEFPSQHWQQIWSTNPLERHLRDGGLEVLADYVTFQTHENRFGADWEPMFGVVEEAIQSLDPINLALEYAFETSMQQGVEALSATLATTTVVAGVADLIDWLGASRPVTGTGVLRRADIHEVAAMMGVAAEGVSKRPERDYPPIDLTRSERSDPNRPFPLPDVWQAQSMREVKPLYAWWEALRVAEIIEVTSSRVRPGPAVAEGFVGDTPDPIVATRLCSNFITQVLTDSVLDEERRYQVHYSILAAEIAVDLLLQAMAPDGEVAPRAAQHPATRKREHSRTRRRQDHGRTGTARDCRRRH